MEFSRCTQAGGPPYLRTTVATAFNYGSARSLKTQQRTDCYVEVDVISRRTEASDEDLERPDIDELGACRSKSLLHP